MCEAHMHTNYAKTRKGLWGMPQKIFENFTLWYWILGILMVLCITKAYNNLYLSIIIK